MISAWLAALGLSYLVGSFPTAFLLVKMLKRIDVRTVGSGNVGATNVTRAAGLKAGIAVFILDALKGVVAVKLVAPRWFAGNFEAALSCGFFSVIGHIAPVWLQFRGGKGVATTLGLLISTMPQVAVVSLALWAVVFLAWRMVSLASLAAVIVVPIVQALLRQSPAAIALGAALAAAAVVKHQANIRRILEATEQRWGRDKR